MTFDTPSFFFHIIKKIVFLHIKLNLQMPRFFEAKTKY